MAVCVMATFVSKCAEIVDIDLRELSDPTLSVLAPIMEKIKLKIPNSTFKELFDFVKAGDNITTVGLSPDECAQLRDTYESLLLIYQHRACRFATLAVAHIKGKALSNKDVNEKKILCSLPKCFTDFMTFDEVPIYLERIFVEEEDYIKALKSYLQALFVSSACASEFKLICEIKSAERRTLPGEVLLSVYKRLSKFEVTLNQISKFEATMNQIKNNMASKSEIYNHTLQLKNIQAALTKGFGHVNKPEVQSPLAISQPPHETITKDLEYIRNNLLQSSDLAYLSKQIKDVLPCGSVVNSISMNVCGAIRTQFEDGFQKHEKAVCRKIESSVDKILKEVVQEDTNLAEDKIFKEVVQEDTNLALNGVRSAVLELTNDLQEFKMYLKASKDKKDLEETFKNLESLSQQEREIQEKKDFHLASLKNILG